MKNKLVFRILGALASALIIASVFIPFVSVTGYSQSLWQTHSAVGTIYLPIMIIAFGAIGVLVFSTGFKTELAYASAGGLLFFLIMQTIPIIDQDVFNTLSVGYYCLVIGTILIMIMAFLCGLRKKQKAVEAPVVEDPKEVSVIDQIDRLYNDSTVNISNENTLSDVIQPIPIQNISVNESISNNNLQSGIQNDLSSVVEPLPLSNIDNQTSVQQLNNDIVVEENHVIKPTLTENNLDVNNYPAEEQPTIMNSMPLENNNFGVEQVGNINPAVSDFNTQEQNINSNPVVAEFSAPANNIQDTIVNNPVVTEFSTPTNNIQDVQGVNPVVAEFSSPDINNIMPNVSEGTVNSNQNVSVDPVQLQSTEQLENQPIESITPLNNENKVDVMADRQNNTTSNLDIFG